MRSSETKKGDIIVSWFLLDLCDAVGPVLHARVQVSVRERHQPPAHGEQQPAAHEGGGEDDQGEAPLEVHQRGENVLQEPALLPDVLVRQVAGAVLGDEARLVHAVPEHRLAGHPGDEPRQPELLRDDAFPRVHADFGSLGVSSQTEIRSRCVFTRGSIDFSGMVGLGGERRLCRSSEGREGLTALSC